VIADIGLMGQPSSQGFWLDPELACQWLPQWRLTAHKYQRGHVVVIGGSREMPGAPLLAAQAALRAGAGMVEVLMPESAASRVSAFLPLIVRPMPQTATGSLWMSGAVIERARLADAVVVGPGLGRGVSAELMQRLFALQVPLVVDADALSLLPPRPWLQYVRAPWVMTPHAGELGRLFGVGADTVNRDRRQWAMRAAREYGAAVLLKGYRTLVCDGQQCGVNVSGGPELATAGSGDVLAGVIGALCAQGLPVFRAALLGAYLHGWAGQLARQRWHRAVTSADVMDSLGEAVASVSQAKAPQGMPEYLRL
jgi:NAD(P)H-hydrate epimerase